MAYLMIIYVSNNDTIQWMLYLVPCIGMEIKVYSLHK